MALRRSFSVAPGERALIVEDVITTGGSVLEVRETLLSAGADVVGIAAVVDRLGTDACPLCAEGMPLIKLGSRVDRPG